MSGEGTETPPSGGGGGENQGAGASGRKKFTKTSAVFCPRVGTKVQLAGLKKSRPKTPRKKRGGRPQKKLKKKPPRRKKRWDKQARNGELLSKLGGGRPRMGVDGRGTRKERTDLGHNSVESRRKAVRAVPRAEPFPTEIIFFRDGTQNFRQARESAGAGGSSGPGGGDAQGCRAGTGSFRDF